MPTAFVNLPAPAGNGSGAAVDVSGLALDKTIVNGGNGGIFEPFVSIEISNDAGATKWTEIFTFSGPNDITLPVACHWMRATVSNYRGGGAPQVDAGSDVGAASFVTLVAPATDGSGAAVATNAVRLRYRGRAGERQGLRFVSA